MEEKFKMIIETEININGLNIKKIIHKGWIEFKRMKELSLKNGDKWIKKYFTIFPKPRFGKYQYIYTNKKGQSISMIKILSGERYSWEIYQTQVAGLKKLFDDTEAFKTKKEAVRKLLII